MKLKIKDVEIEVFSVEQAVQLISLLQEKVLPKIKRSFSSHARWTKDEIFSLLNNCNPKELTRHTIKGIHAMKWRLDHKQNLSRKTKKYIAEWELNNN